MNDTLIDEAAIAETDPRVSGQSDLCATATRMCGSPRNAVLCAIGAGLVIGLLVRALRPDPTPTQRLAHLLSDFEERLCDATGPALRKVGAYASDRADTVRGGLHSGEARLERVLRDATRRVRRLFS